MREDWEDGYWVNRTLCSVLEDMRLCVKTTNFAPMMGLIEEAQIKGNRMEAGLDDKKDLLKLNEEWREIKVKVMTARRELKELTGGKSE